MFVSLGLLLLVGGCCHLFQDTAAVHMGAHRAAAGSCLPRRAPAFHLPACLPAAQRNRLPAATCVLLRAPAAACPHRLDRSMYPLSLSTRSTMTGSCRPTCTPAAVITHSRLLSTLLSTQHAAHAC